LRAGGDDAPITARLRTLRADVTSAPSAAGDGDGPESAAAAAPAAAAPPAGVTDRPRACWRRSSDKRRGGRTDAAAAAAVAAAAAAREPSDDAAADKAARRHNKRGCMVVSENASGASIKEILHAAELVRCVVCAQPSFVASLSRRSRRLHRAHAK
jgi:hypothetical protein